MSTNNTTPPTAPSFAQALAYWLWLGCISFGGPAGQISIMHQDLVERKRWISERRFLHALNYCMVLPGPEAQQLATYLGWLLHGKWGGLAAGSLFVLPSLLLLIALSWLYMAFGNTPAIAGLLYGIKPAVTAIVAFAAWRIGRRTLHSPGLAAIAAAAFCALFFFALPFPAIILAAAACGWLGTRLAPQYFAAVSAHAATTRQNHGAALIDDDTPTPPHARYSSARFLRTLIVGLVLWGTALAALTFGFGWDGVLTRMGWFFTKAALLTFGGAYAVLPYVFQGAVEQFLWLSAGQMIDGLALGESTPGPLIMVTAFVGFVGAWQHPPFGSEHLFAGGAAGALVVTFFTFLPSFVFIFLGAPLIEKTHGNLHLAAPLNGITAAVVGVIASLALFFAWHVYWPQGWHGPFEWPALVIGVSALYALSRWPTRVILIIAGSAVAGLVV
ncbi:MAG: chromate efflux transporter [Propionivibrio sp.]|uniref:Chromate efflux transporter n=1 Tax=Candidatus Propionivibrio dominans TaxID=2954373 RepID=A0A9D7FHJ1_9RHOO|nr:chromate efflux transporter [Candidatus Propionivibrio dominans]MBL0166237.1 chromate efflux transporter [Propionivibrio sp.]